MLKCKYSNLLTEKQAQTEELITCEEDKLSVCKCLVQLKLSYCELQEQIEKERFEKENEVLLLKSKLEETDDKVGIPPN
jgi:hypothetical protein